MIRRLLAAIHHQHLAIATGAGSDPNRGNREPIGNFRRELGRSVHDEILRFKLEAAKRMLEQGIAPASISTDITKPGRIGRVKSMTHTMSKFLALGFSLTDVLSMSTYAPAGLIGYQQELGTLAEGTAADIAILEEVQGKWTFDDAGGEIIGGDKALVPVLTFKDGDQFAPDYGPFPWGWLPNPLE